MCGVLSFTKDIFSLTELTDVTDLICAQFRTHEKVAPPPSPPPQGRGVVCEVTPIGLLHGSWGVLFLTERTDVTELFHQRFEPTERLRHTEFTERYC